MSTNDPTAQWLLTTDIGPLYLVASEKGLRGAYFQKQDSPLLSSLEAHGRATQVLAQAARELTEYFKGERQTFAVPLDLVGTEFQVQVWRELSKIPYGQTCSYRDIAVGIENAKAVRAVGSANGRNPLCIIIPCHRVIASDGTLGGYTGGLQIKTKLLSLERASPPSGGWQAL